MSERIRISGDAMKVSYRKGAGILSGGNWHVTCGRQHRTFGTVARCRWPDAAWIAGDGPYAVVCAGPVTVSLCATEDEARAELELSGRIGCGSGCARVHEVYVLRAGDDESRWHAAHP